MNEPTVSIPRSWLRGLWACMGPPAVCPSCGAQAPYPENVRHKPRCELTELLDLLSTPAAARVARAARRKRS